VAEALSPDATVDSILAASTAYLHKKCSALMIDTIASVLEMAKKAADYQTLREQYYATKLLNIISDSRETIPAVLAIFYLAQAILSGRSSTRSTSVATRIHWAR
jgi:hypothetical protein